VKRGRPHGPAVIGEKASVEFSIACRIAQKSPAEISWQELLGSLHSDTTASTPGAQHSRISSMTRLYVIEKASAARLPASIFSFNATRLIMFLVSYFESCGHSKVAYGV
jgi:hypothetical protein